jgi:hypothetical protein
MGISVNLANPTTLAAQTSLSSAVLNQSSADAKTLMSPMTITVDDPAVAAARLAKFLQAMGAPLIMGTDAQHIATALTPTMLSIVSERPDLANANFDFRSNNGSIQVESTSLSASDKAWIQGKLESNANLVQAVQSFHDHAVAGYATFSDANGAPLTQAESAAVSRKADGLGGFLNLFQSLGNAAQKYLEEDGTYKTSDGQTMNLAQDPRTAAGFLGFINSAQAATNGTFNFVSNSGHNFNGSQMNVFNNDSVIPNFFPPSPAQSLGLNEVA